MEHFLQAIALGIVQGATEFLPISSSGHLIVTRELFGWEFSDDLTFDVALHLGTTIAVFAYFWPQWVEMARRSLSWLANRGRAPEPVSVYSVRLLSLLILGSIPAALVGLPLEGYVEDNVRSPIVVGAMLLTFGFILMLSERIGKRQRSIDKCNWQDALIIGCAQAMSLVPGVSRSGATITAGLGRNLTREDAARFSFLLATPVIAGAGLIKIAQAASDGIPRDDLAAMAGGTFAAAIIGWLAIRYLLMLLQTRGYGAFVFYRLAAGVFVLSYFLA